jgi:hypothetical protein
MLYSIRWMATRPHLRREPEQRWTGILTWFLVGGLVGGGMMGALIALPAVVLFSAFHSSPAVFIIVAAALAAIYAGQAANLWRVPKPQFPHQVPESWRNVFDYKAASFVYAGGLGTLYFTRLASAAAYPLAVLLLGMGQAPIAIIEIMATVGLVRASTALIVPLRRLDVADSGAVPTWIEKHSVIIRYGELIVLIGLLTIPVAWLLMRYA